LLCGERRENSMDYNPLKWFKKEPLRNPVLPPELVPGQVVLKKLKWVRLRDEIGIVTELDASGYVTVDIVDSNGFTVRRVREPQGNAHLARYMEIPESRRPADPAYAATLGYV
jgi:hypothetical protein